MFHSHRTGDACGWSLRVKRHGARPRVGSEFWSIPTCVSRILKGVAGVVIDFHIDRFVDRVHALFERSNFLGRHPAIESAKRSEHLRIDALKVHGVRRQRAIIHDTRSQPRLMNGELERITSAHGPAYRTNVLWIHIRPTCQIIKCGSHRADHEILPKPALQLAGFKGADGHCPVVEIHGEHHVSIRR